MRPFEFVIAIIAITLTYSAFMALLRSRRARSETDDSALQADVQADRERLEALEERVAVLERIITDRKSALHRQFADLE
jgi:hypothetical protein